MMNENVSFFIKKRQGMHPYLLGVLTPANEVLTLFTRISQDRFLKLSAGKGEIMDFHW
jgi:hypothetical protein